jgi:hypothetical protein
MLADAFPSTLFAYAPGIILFNQVRGGCRKKKMMTPKIDRKKDMTLNRLRPDTI